MEFFQVNVLSESGALSFLKDLAQKEQKSVLQVEQEFFQTLRPKSLIKSMAVLFVRSFEIGRRVFAKK
jgi:hypothetical protein